MDHPVLSIVHESHRWKKGKFEVFEGLLKITSTRMSFDEVRTLMTVENKINATKLFPLTCASKLLAIDLWFAERYISPRIVSCKTI